MVDGIVCNMEDKLVRPEKKKQITLPENFRFLQMLREKPFIPRLV
jgi:hypothetical protein